MRVENIFKENKIGTSYVKLGEVELKRNLSNKQVQKISDDLQKVGFELLDEHKTQLIERIKTLLIEKVQTGNIEEHFGIQKFLSEKIFKDYSSLSKLFSEVEG